MLASKPLTPITAVSVLDVDIHSDDVKYTITGIKDRIRHSRIQYDHGGKPFFQYNHERMYLSEFTR